MSQPSPLLASLGLFTVLPVPTVPDVDRTVARGAMLAFPVVGLVLGGLAAVVAGGVAWLGLPLLAAVLGLTTWAALTGALHLDGVADTADGLGSRKPAGQALEIMRRSDIGPMGVVSLLLVLLAGVAALAGLLEQSAWAGAAALAWTPLLGRVAVVAAVGSGAPGARQSGFGALFDGVVGRAAGWAWVLVGVLGAGGLGWLVGDWRWAAGWAAAAAAALGVARLWRGHLVRRLSGMTGDTFGSLIELTQVVFLVLVAALTAV